MKELHNLTNGEYKSLKMVFNLRRSKDFHSYRNRGAGLRLFNPPNRCKLIG